MKVGFSILREVMVEGYRRRSPVCTMPGRPSTYPFDDGKCVLIFMAEGNPLI